LEADRKAAAETSEQERKAEEARLVVEAQKNGAVIRVRSCPFVVH